MSDKIIGDFEIVDHGIEHSQYFQGCGTSCTPYTEAATGIGDDFAEAIDDALEFIAHGDYSTEGMDERILTELGVDALPTLPSVPRDLDEDQDSEFWYHVSIRYREALRWEVIVGNIGSVYSGYDRELAETTYGYYSRLIAEDLAGRAEYPITLLCDDEIAQEVNA